MIKWIKNWGLFCFERFNPFIYIPTLFVFTVANISVVMSGHWPEASWPYMGLIFLMVLSYFFRLRLFDEIKDYDTDLKINPHRPLARGLLSLRQVKIALLFLILFELAASSYLGASSFTVQTVAILYSLLMYKEFFIGSWLRPRLTTYAVTHTFSSVLIATSAAVSATGIDFISKNNFYFFLSNWFYFNFFEFSRKTFAPAEERPQVDSYSSIFSPLGALFLSLSQIMLGVYFIRKSLPFYDLKWLYVASLVFLIFCIPFQIRQNQRTAQLFRSSSGLFLIINYAVIVYLFWS